MLTFKQVKTQWLVGVYPMAFSFIYFFKRLARLSGLRLAHLSSGLQGNAENPTWGSPLHCDFGTHCCGFQEMLWLFLRFFFFFFLAGIDFQIADLLHSCHHRSTLVALTWLNQKKKQNTKNNQIPPLLSKKPAHLTCLALLRVQTFARLRRKPG